MTYIKKWENQPNLNKVEKMKLKKDGLEIYNDIPKYAKEGFDSIPKEEWDLFKYAGLYLQRPKEDGYFMLRVNIPSGVLSYNQAIVLSSIAKDYGRGVYDITTRQAVQFHWLTIEDIPDIFNRLKSGGLSSAGACGDITRNIVGNPLAGIDGDELLDTRPIVEEIYQLFQRNSDFSNLPRKYKVSISSNVYNASNAEINCLSFIPATKKISGEEKVGFHVKVGGGLSSKPYLAETLNMFVLPEQVKDVAVAVTTIFRDYGYREKRHRARLKFLVADWGKEKFQDKLEEYVGEFPTLGKDETKGWNAGYFYGVHSQKQEGLSYVGLNIPVGRLRGEDIQNFANISKKYGDGELRHCNSQNLIIPNVKNENIDQLLEEPIIRNKYKVKPPIFMGYAVSCTGIEYCNLALVETKERMRELAKSLDERISLDVPVRIHIVGCPNSCGQRQIADIGLQGIKIKTKDKRLVEAFEIYIGGTLENGGEFNQKLKGKVEADQLLSALVYLLNQFKDQKKTGENFLKYIDRVGVDSIQETFNQWFLV
ncbi:nitrite/sulfite reductase [Bacillus carboniphilus]|uniref:Nitrite/sulfite reductase n=1 Tax=Bacillus carboniphilus TaxID=86663 RepID=A0ABY9JXS7_9BACI|nr:nitrite/sulfite reductase [Bacillus carboniphilus]WLR43589.1 nitrite/sulfite reductase [Bacillus carboniphilus]